MDLDASMDHDEWLLLGTDLVKDPRPSRRGLRRRRGVTAEFNRNVLRVLNRELDADFDLGAFEHVARWNAASVDRDAAAVRAGPSRSGSTASTSTWTSPRARSSGPRSRPSSPPTACARSSGRRGFVVEATWTDPAGDFLLTLAHPYC